EQFLEVFNAYPSARRRWRRSGGAGVQVTRFGGASGELARHAANAAFELSDPRLAGIGVHDLGDGVRVPLHASRLKSVELQLLRNEELTRDGELLLVEI